MLLAIEGTDDVLLHVFLDGGRKDIVIISLTEGEVNGSGHFATNDGLERGTRVGGKTRGATAISEGLNGGLMSTGDGVSEAAMEASRSEAPCVAVGSRLGNEAIEVVNHGSCCRKG